MTVEVDTLVITEGNGVVIELGISYGEVPIVKLGAACRSKIGFDEVSGPVLSDVPF